MTFRAPCCKMVASGSSPERRAPRDQVEQRATTARTTQNHYFVAAARLPKLAGEQRRSNARLCGESSPGLDKPRYAFPGERNKMTEVLLRSRLPAPPPQCLSMRRRVARTIERQTLPERAWRFFIRKGKKGGEARRAAPGERTAPVLGVCHAPRTDHKKIIGLSRGISAARGNGAAPLCAWRSLPGRGGRGEGRSPRPKPAKRAKAKKKGPRRGPARSLAPGT